MQPFEQEVASLKETVRKAGRSWRAPAAGAIVGVVALLVGCSSAGRLDPWTQPLALLEEKDQFKIKEVVYGYLLQRDFWGEGAFSAVFVKENVMATDALIQRFPDHVPRIKPSDRLRLSPGSSPIDRDTGQPAMVLDAIVSEPVGSSAEAVGTYYAGPAVSGKYVFSLKRVDDQWRIESVK
jgi:hypothetical protein